jgi:hypothetical protein
MKKLVICFDGTWNTKDQEENGILIPTNVVKIYNAVANEDDKGIRQLKYYHPGLGGEGGIVKSITGGAFGAGITRHICSAYHWIASNYEEGDEIFLYGFSRGAFTVRSLAGFLGKGLLNLDNLQDKESWRRVHKAYSEGYRKKDPLSSDWKENNWKFFNEGAAVEVKFLGVWDTVGALGIPDDLEILNIFDTKSSWQFHDTKLGKHIKSARHAMAIDEIRSSFTVTRWESEKERDIKEVWFPGVHSDVGGGYAQTDLSNGALLWMMQESENSSLKFRKNIKKTIKADPLGVMHDSYKGIFAKMRSRPRSIAAIDKKKNKNLFHSSVFERQKISPIEYFPYHPTTILGINESKTIDIFADTKWNYTGIYLEKGARYEFSSTGEWRDSKDSCSWEGTEDGKLTFGDIARLVGSTIGKIEKSYEKLTGNENSDFFLTKRVEDFSWFTMVGAIANDKGVKNDGSPNPHEYYELVKYQKGNSLEVKNSGYLYCFPNDVWALYGNNHGSVKLTVKRVL